MPAAEPLPSLTELVNAYQGGLVSERPYGDFSDGSIHDHWAGAGAVLWLRMAERDQQEFRSIYFNDARGQRLDDYTARRFPEKPRVLSNPGGGTVRLSRPNTSAGGGMFLAKTRLAIGSPGPSPLAYYELIGDTSCGATELVKTLAIDAVGAGGSEIRVKAGDRPIMEVADPLWDNTWQIDSLVCSAATRREDDDPYRARIRYEVLRERLGYEAAIADVMAAAGASTVVMFRSDFLGEANDFGMNRVYVGDANFETSAALLLACRLAMPRVGLAGAAIQALPMTTTWLDLWVNITFWQNPESFDTDTATKNAQAAAVEYFETRENPFAWDLIGLQGAIRRVVEDTQTIAITPSLSPPVISTIFDTSPIQRFRTATNRVQISFS